MRVPEKKRAERERERERAERDIICHDISPVIVMAPLLAHL